MQQQGHGVHRQEQQRNKHESPLRDVLDKRRPSYNAKMLGGDERYTKSTASSRSRAGQHTITRPEPQLNPRKSIKELRQDMNEERSSPNEDGGMSRDRIFKVFAQVEDSLEQQTRSKPAVESATRRKTSVIQENTMVRLRRKSRAQPEEETNRTMSAHAVKRSTVTVNGASSNESPRVKALNAKKSTENLSPSAAAAAAAAARRRPSALGSSSPRVQPTDTRQQQASKLESSSSDTDQSNSSCDRSPTKAQRQQRSVGKPTRAGPTNIRLADALRDSLSVERKLARQELGLSSEKAAASSHAARTTAVKSPNNEVANKTAALRRTLDTRRKSAAAVASERERTTAELISDAKRRLSLGKEKIKDIDKAAAATSAATPRRRTLSSGNILRTGLREELARRKSTVATTPPTTTTDGHQSSYMKPTLAADLRRKSLAGGEESLVMQATKRRSALASSSSKNGSRASSAASSSGTTPNGGSPGENEESARKTPAATAAAASRRRSMSRRGSSIVVPDTVRSRKKSIVAMDDSSLNVRRQRRLSRTESLKEGVPTSPSLNAALAWRKKSQDAAAKLASSTKEVKTHPGIRKRGKVKKYIVIV